MTAAIVLAASLALAGENGKSLPANTWVKVEVGFSKALADFLGGKKGGWSQSDGYSDNLYRARTGEVLIRTGVVCREIGYSPGFYTNASVLWDLATDTAKVINVANWGGGSGGHGRLLPAFKDHPTPTPRHTYDGMAYIPEKDVMYMMLGANWRVGGRGANPEAKARLKVDNGLTWKYDFKTNRWSSIDHNVWKLFKCSPYEAHLVYWADGNKLLFFDSSGSRYAEFNLEKEKWEAVPLKNKTPMSLYNARSAWDSKRNLWIFRLGPRLCTFNPADKSFEALPPCYDMKIPTRDELKKMKKEDRDPRLVMKPVCYVSRHDRYLVAGPTGNDTVAYDPEAKKWTPVKGGDLKLINGYMKYNPELDAVAMNFQLKCFKLKYVPAGK
ncbi:MAG: hypothetical protein ACYTGB_09165 [Planctomycetota bacterium]|jgi:hypothetical protein